MPTDSAAILGTTPIGVAIYLAVGVGASQFVLGRRTRSSLRLGVAALAIGAAALSILAGVVTGSLTETWQLGVTPLLLLVVFDTLIGTSDRAFWTGYRARA